MEFNNKTLEKLAHTLKKFDRKITISCISGLFTIPEFHPNTYRLEILAQAVCCYCDGREKPSLFNISRWLNEILQSQARFEDPPEDVFISNVTSHIGNFLIFEGIWESNDFYLQQVIDCISSSDTPSQFKQLPNTIFSILKMGDAVAKRAKLKRWDENTKTKEGKIYISPDKKVYERAIYTIFSEEDLAVLNINLNDLEIFILKDEHREQLAFQTSGNSFLEKHPIVQIGNEYILALPTAVSPAIKFYVLEWMQQYGLTEPFEHQLHLQQINQINDKLNKLSTIPATIPVEIEDESDSSVKNWELLNLASKIFQFDTDKYAHVVLLKDKVGEVLDTGFFNSLSYSDSYQELLDDFLNKKSLEISEKFKVSSGMTILILGGLGRSHSIGIKKLENWHLIGMPLVEFMQFTWSKDVSLLRLWKLYEQKKYIEEQRIKISHSSSSALNLYAFWLFQDYRLVNDKMDYSQQYVLSIAPSFILDLRRNIRKVNDFHMVSFNENENDNYVFVERFFKKSYYSSLAASPIYVSYDRHLCGVIETKHCAWWLVHEYQQECEAGYDIVYRLWEALIQWLDRLLPIIETELLVDSFAPVKILFIVNDLNKIHDYDELSTFFQPNPQYPLTTIDSLKNQILLIIPLSFLAVFQQPENTAERILVEKIGKAIIELIEMKLEVSKSLSISNIVSQFMKDKNARYFHILHTKYLHEILASINPLQARLIQQEDVAFCQLGLAWLVEQNIKTRKINGKEKTKAFLNQLVGKLWDRVRGILESIDCYSLIVKAYKNLEALYQDKNQWYTTANALLSLHDDTLTVANKQDHERTRTILATRILIEMAICTCPSSDVNCSESQFDFLLANIAILLDCAYTSDEINWDIIQPEIKIYPNGEFDMSNSFIEQVTFPYRTSLFNSYFIDAALIYDSYFRKNDTLLNQVEDIYSKELIEAFIDEYDISLSRVHDGVAELCDISAYKKQAVVQIEYTQLMDFFTKNRNFTKTELTAFLNIFSLFPRLVWNEVPAGFNKRDWVPWRYRRQLSLVMRPLVSVDKMSNEITDSSRIVYGITQLYESCEYFLELINQAWLPTETLKKNGLMSQFIGRQTKELGRQFEEKTLKLLQEQGWICKASVQMKSLGASKKDKDLGEIDIFAWKNDCDYLLQIECKRLLPIKTSSEIGEMFSDFTKNELKKHMDRYEWIKVNSEKVFTYLGIKNNKKLVPILISSTEVPLRFKLDLEKDLKILSFDILQKGIFI